MGAAPPSIWVGIAGLICRKVGLDPVVLRKDGFSLNDTESLGAIVPAPEEKALYAAMV
jgi:hypothetical protein